MQIGAMNHPMRDVVEEILWLWEHGFQFIDLTLEPEAAYSASLPIENIKAALSKTGLQVIGHTAYYLPIASPFPEIRECALKEIERDICIFAELGAKKVNVHPFTNVPLHDNRWVREMNIRAFTRLKETCDTLGLKLMVENVPPLFNTPSDLAAVFSAVPGLGLHLDVGHANLMTEHNQTLELATLFSDRLEHVHFSDNKGDDADLHLPLGAGKIDWPWIVHILKRVKYDGTITLEVFTEDLDYLLLSRDKLVKLWERVKV